MKCLKMWVIKKSTLQLLLLLLLVVYLHSFRITFCCMRLCKPIQCIQLFILTFNLKGKFKWFSALKIVSESLTLAPGIMCIIKYNHFLGVCSILAENLIWIPQRKNSITHLSLIYSQGKMHPVIALNFYQSWKLPKQQC